MTTSSSGRNQDRQDFKVVGQWGIPGRQSFAMATGAAKYNRDLTAPGMLFARPLRSPYARATITSLDVSEARDYPGVVLIVTYDDEELKTMPKVISPWFGKGADVLGATAEYEGDEVGCIIVAKSEDICDEAMKLVHVEWQILPHVIDPREGIRPGAPVILPAVNPDSNIGGAVWGIPETWEDGNVEEGFKQADHILEFDFCRPQMNVFRPNPDAYLAYWEQDGGSGLEGKTLHISCPNIYSGIGVKASAANMFGITDDKVRALTPYLGGRYCDYQEKRGASLAPVLAQRTGKPVLYSYSRRDIFDAGASAGYSHIRVGFTDDGMIVAAQGKFVHEAGARGGYGDKLVGWLTLPMQMTAFRGTKCTNIYSEHKTVITNAQGCSQSQATSARWDGLACAFHLIAEELGMDPTEVALTNVHTPEPSLKMCIDAGKEAIDWDNKWHSAGTRTLENGNMHGMGIRVHDAYTWGMINYSIVLTLRSDGKIYMPFDEGLPGTYWPDACSMVIAEELGTKVEDVIVYYTHSPNWVQGDATDRGSSTTWAAKEAAIDLRAKILGTASALLGVTPEELDIKDSLIYVIANPETVLPLASVGAYSLSASFVGKPTPPYDDSLRTLKTMNCDFCEVEVDTDAGEVRIINWVVTHDCGKVIRPSTVHGQLENIMVESTGLCLTQENIYDSNTGVLLNGSALNYKIPTRLDMPPIQTLALESRLGGGCYGATGISHTHAHLSIICLAVYNAIGQWINTVPITPDKVLKALGKA